MRLEATTRHWSPGDRVERWREEFGRLVVRAEVEADGPRPEAFTVDAALSPGAQLSLGHVYHDAARTGRNHRLVRDGSEDVTLLMLRSGAFRYRTTAREDVLTAGEAMIFSHTVASQGWWRKADALMLLLPRALVAEVMDLERDSGAKLPIHREASLLLRSYAETAWSLGRLSALTERHLAELVRAALSPETPARPAPPRAEAVTAARLERFRGLLAGLAADPGLTVDGFARHAGVSTRTVQRVFAAAGGSFGDELTRLRLETALQQLRGPDADRRRISSIAYGVGFSDLSRFNHAFRARYGLTPSDARAQALSAASTG
jgi:AraC-like DNA-binding protein